LKDLRPQNLRSLHVELMKSKSCLWTWKEDLTLFQALKSEREHTMMMLSLSSVQLQMNLSVVLMRTFWISKLKMPNSTKM